MSAFFFYIFKVSCWIAIWWLIYHIFLRKETFYTFNRIYLMTGLAASFLIPLMTIHYPVEIFVSLTSNDALTKNIQPPERVDFYAILFYLYVFFGAFFIIRQLFLLFKINILIKSSGYTIVNGCRVVDSPDTKIPFSFFKYIFCNFQQISEEEKQLILVHEHSHIIQLHRIDLFIAESIRIFLWFNPFAWLYLQSIKENHEYLADKAVLNSGYSPVNYRAALINQSLTIPVFSLANSFTSYKFKRIFMMKKESSNPLKKLAVLLLVPAAGFFLWAFAEPEYHVNATEITQQTSNVNLSANDSVPSPKDTLKSEVHQDFSPLVFIDGKESAVSLKDIDPDRIESVSVLKNESATSVYGEKGKNGVILITTKKINKSPERTDPLLFIDGKESAVSLKDIDPNRIESISVLKNESATTLYGEKGKNGVILITTKK